MNALRNELEALYVQYNNKEFLNWDPLGRVDPDLPPEDFELVSLIAAGLAYGRVEQAMKSLSALLERISTLKIQKNGKGLAHYLRNHFDKKTCGRHLKGWKHRLNTSHDIVLLFEGISLQLQNHASLCHVFQTCSNTNTKEQIEDFCEKVAPLKQRPKGTKGTGASWFFASPSRGSSCKRLMLWLKWMIREDEIDTGLWVKSKLVHKKLPRPSSRTLFFPVDTHIFKWAQQRDITLRKTISWAFVEEITAFFRSLNPEDPAKYDFALCHEGILEYRKKDKTPF